MDDAARSGQVGLIANPVSARDIRRVVANASSLQVTDRTNIVLRALTAAGSVGVERIVAMPDKKGIRASLERAIERERNLGRALPNLEFVDMAVTSTVADTHTAARAMAEQGVDAIIVLGGDGTHRAVVSTCGAVPIAGLSTGTNNAYPELRESTITGLAVGMYATGWVPRSVAVVSNKLLAIDVNDGQRTDLALVDAVASTDRYIGARALWKMETIVEVFTTFAEPTAIGMSAIASALESVSRADPHGLHVRLDSASERRVLVPIGPGMVEPVGVGSWSRIVPGTATEISPRTGTIALDGEREVELAPQDRATVTLRTDGFGSIDVEAVMAWASASEILTTLGGRSPGLQLIDRQDHPSSQEDADG